MSGHKSNVWRFVWLLMLLIVGGACARPGQEPTGAFKQFPAGEFRINLISEPDTIDPNRANFSQSVAVASQVFEGLFAYDKDLKLVPAVAKEIPSTANGGISADGMTYTIKLRDSKWSDGQAVKAKDFVYAIKRSLDPKIAAPYASSLYDIEGAEAYNTALDTKDNAKQLSDVQLTALRDAVAVSAPDEINTLPPNENLEVRGQPRLCETRTIC
jgi:oligopeptide transport system substrate-binding protein